jgi:hypothetical protein
MMRIHHPYRLQRKFTAGGFCRQHDGVGATEHGVGHVAASARVGRGESTIDAEHFGRHDHRLAVNATGADDLLLDDRHGLGRQLDAQVTARHHRAVGGAHDRVERSTAPGVSILAMIGVGLPLRSQISRSSCTSSARRTNESAT